MFIAAGNNENFNFAKSIGVGLISSSINLVSLIMKENINNLIFVGSAGSYDFNLNIGDIFYSFDATQIEISFSENKSYTPLDNYISLESIVIDSKLLNIKNLKLPKCTVNSSNYISTDESFSKKMSAIAITLENMEFFSIMQVAKSFNIPCIGLFCISNYCNEFARQDFIKNHSFVKDRLTNFINEQFLKP